MDWKSFENDSENTAAEAAADDARVAAGVGAAAAVATEPAAGDPSAAALVEAAGEAENDGDARAVMTGLADTPGLEAGGIASDVLERLLPGDEVTVLPVVERAAGGPLYRAAKRAFDVAASAAALVVLAIPMGVVALKIKSESPGPVIYSQRRVGKGGRVFRLHKFRSMYADAEARGARWAAEGDPRVTPFGRFMRRTRIDEVPQFWNVVKGDMSLIGPRPERPAFCEEFRKRIVGWDQRTLVRPGITGLAQVEGGYELLPKEKALLDVEYIESRSVALDARIIAKTVRTVFSGEGAR